MYLVVKREHRGMGYTESTNLKAFKYYVDAKEYIECVAKHDLEQQFDRNADEHENEIYRLTYSPNCVFVEYIVQDFEVCEACPEEVKLNETICN